MDTFELEKVQFIINLFIINLSPTDVNIFFLNLIKGFRSKRLIYLG